MRVGLFPFRYFNVAADIADIFPFIIHQKEYALFEDSLRNILNQDSSHEEILKLILNISCMACKASEQVLTQGQVKQQQFVEKKMRSRQRNTYKRMLNRCRTLDYDQAMYFHFLNF